MIAAFTDDDRDADLAEILTQEQADSVREYLVDKHAIQSAGWFKTRKVAAVGFGTHMPPTLDPSPRRNAVPPRRDHRVHPADVADRGRNPTCDEFRRGNRAVERRQRTAKKMRFFREMATCRRISLVPFELHVSPFCLAQAPGSSALQSREIESTRPQCLWEE